MPDFNYKQRPWSRPVTDEEYRRIFRPSLSCQGCFSSWQTKDAFPCRACIRVSPAMRYPYDGDLTDLYHTVHKEDMSNPSHFKDPK